MNQKLFESIYFKNQIYFHGDTDEAEELILGREKYEGKGIYISTSPSYTLLYTLVDSKGKYKASRKGFIYLLKLKNDVNLFNAGNEKDIEKLSNSINKFTELTDKDIENLKKDWCFFLKRKPENMINSKEIYWSKKDVIEWIKEAGFDGFINNEDWKIWIKQELYHSTGPGIFIFNTTNLEVIDKIDNIEFAKEHSIDIKNILQKI